MIQSKALLLFFFAISLLALFYSVLMQDFSFYPERLDYVFPGLLSFGGAAFLGKLIFRRSVNDAADAGAGARQLRSLAAVVIIVSVYIAGVPLMGFALSTWLFQLVMFFYVFAKRSFAWLVCAPLALTVILSFFFAHLLSVPLPRGVGVFYFLNAWLI